MNDVSLRPPLPVDLWRRMPAELGYLLLGMPIAIAGLTVFITLVSLGVSLAVFTVGLFVLAGALLAARAFGRLERDRLRRAGRPAIASPTWPVPDPSRGVMWRALTPLRDGASWRYLLHAGLVQPVLGIVTWSVALTWAVLGLGGITYWFWIRFIPMTGENILLHRVILDAVFPANGWTSDPVLGENVLYLIVGLFALVTLPLVTRSLTLLHWAAAAALLSPGRAALLREEVATLAASRGCRWISLPQNVDSSATHRPRAKCSRRHARRHTTRSKSCGRCRVVSPRRSCRIAGCSPGSRRSPSAARFP